MSACCGMWSSYTESRLITNRNSATCGDHVSAHHNQMDTYAGAIPERLSGDVLRALSRVSVTRSWFHIALEWLSIAAAIALGEWLHHWYGYVAAVIWIGARQHALAILMHEGTHYRVATNRW